MQSELLKKFSKALTPVGRLLTPVVTFS